MSQFTLQEEFEEANRELLECARYGETEDLENLIVRGADCNYADNDTGNTPLHRAAANGEVGCIKVLIKHKCRHVQNKQGNFPIHWAAQNGKIEALKLIFDSFPADEIDVLKQNSFGRSTLTEAFSSKNTECIEIVLSQPSASEDKLLHSTSTSESVPMDEDETANVGCYDEKNGISHSMYFTKGDSSSQDCVIQIRELPITRADDPFGTETNPEDDTTGLGVWPASILLSHYINTFKRDLIRGGTIVELGAGCGLPAIAAAKLCGARTIYLTDIHESTLRNACYNVHLNNNDGQPTAGVTSNRAQYILDEAAGTTCDLNVSRVNWSDVKSYPPSAADVILGSDLVYDKNILSILVPAIMKMLKLGGSFLYVAPALGNQDRAGLDALDGTLLSSGFEHVESINCPSEFYRNVLVPSSVAASGSEFDADEDVRSMVDDMNDQFVLHFYDLSAMKPHTCHHYVKTL